MVEPRAQAAAGGSSFHHLLLHLLSSSSFFSSRGGGRGLLHSLPIPHPRHAARPGPAPPPPHPRPAGPGAPPASVPAGRTGSRRGAPSPLAARLRGVAGTWSSGKDFPPAPSPAPPPPPGPGSEISLKTIAVNEDIGGARSRVAVAGSATPRASERAGVPRAGRAAVSPRASLSGARGTRAAARGPAGPGGPGRRRWRGRAAGAQPAKSPEPSLPPREPGESGRGCPARSAPCRARLARVRGETCPSQALHRPRLICKQRKVSGAPSALLPHPRARRTWPRAEHRSDRRPPRLRRTHSPPNRLGRRLGGSRGRDTPEQPVVDPARAQVGGEVMQLHLTRPGHRGASGNFGDASEERGCASAMSVPDKRHSFMSARQP